jgi:predicted O-methyltransferase YrrM
MKDLLEKSLEDSKSFPIKGVMPALRLLNSGALEDVLNVNGNRYYQFLPCLIDNMKPHQVIELGGAMGVADVMMLQSKHQAYTLYSVTLPEHGLEFSMVADDYNNLVKIIGDDLDPKIWPYDIRRKETDLWFIDTLHTKEQLTKELELYTPFFKKGAIVLFDDIHMPELEPVWDLLCQRYDHYDLTDPCHYSGFGAIQI